MARFHASYDLLLTPTLPLPAFEVGHLLPPAGGWGAMDRLGALQLSQQPAASLPCGVTQRGLPVGLQLVGAIGRDGARASRAYEAVAPFLMLEAPRQY
jgi:aspartyl-tRNA(Asn)/glutamyl-tRNA(Gln) amidotransferase subunit A